MRNLIFPLALGLLHCSNALVSETPHTRKYFYVGGRYVTNDNGQHFFKDQMYVEELMPTGGPTKDVPLILIHGMGQTGTNWLTKPDGNPGWASYFLSKGYTVYIVDQTSRGRSPWLPPPVNNATSLLAIGAESIERQFTAPELYKSYPSAHLHTQWPGGPGKGVRGQVEFDTYLASVVPSVFSAVAQQKAMQAAGAALLDRIGRPAIVLGHSEGGAYPWIIADARPKLVHAIIALEPAGPPFGSAGPGGRAFPSLPWGLTDIPVAYDPPVVDPATDFVKKVLVTNETGKDNCTLQADSPPPRQLVNLLNIPVLVMNGEASWHSSSDWCIAAFLRQAGVKNTTHIDLGEAGVKGNGHMMFLEMNSDESASVMLKWIEGLKTK